MERSPSIQNLTQSLAKFHAMVGRISKDAKNPFFKSNYASLPHIITEIAEPLEKAGLVLSQFPNGDGLTTMLIHADSGEFISATYTLQVVRQNDPQAQGSAISYARRYAITSVLNLAISDDHEAFETGTCTGEGSTYRAAVRRDSTVLEWNSRAAEDSQGGAKKIHLNQ